MARRRIAGELQVWMNGEHVGEWRVSAQGRHEFSYAAEWLSSSYRRPLSLSLPLRTEPYGDALVRAFFDNLLPENEAVRRRLAARHGLSRADAFELLGEIGRDCVGAVQLLPTDMKPEVRKITGEQMSAHEVAKHLRSLSAGAPLQQYEDHEFRISLAGNQDKTALLRQGNRWLRPTGATPSTHILKPPIGETQSVDLSESVDNEWLCALIAREFGLPAADCEIATFDDQRVLVVERFDRRPADDGSWIIRLPQEDLCQATGTPATKKYESQGGPGIERIDGILRGSDDADGDRRSFLRAQVLFWLLCATDGHAKNFSLFLEAGGGYRLTPLYDILSVYPVLGRKAGQLSPHKVKLAMAVWGKNRHYRWDDIRARHFVETAKSCGVEDGERTVVELIESAEGAAASAERKLRKGLSLEIAERILGGLRAKAKEALRQL